MSDEIREQLSALMDGELPRDQVRFLLRRIDGDVQLAQAWTRYQVVSSVLRRRTALQPLRAGFTEALMQRIEVGPSQIGSRLLRWAGGGAIAAAVAVFALVSTRPPAGAPEPAALVGAGPTTAASAPIEVAAKRVLPPQPVFELPPLQPAFDFTQPAAAVVTLPRYRHDTAAEPQQMLGPYVLLTAPTTAQAESAPQH